MQRLAAGDETALKELFDAWNSKLYTYVYKIIGSREVAEEVVMDVFFKLWAARDMAVRIKHFERFLFRVAYNLAIDVWRASSKDPVLLDLIFEHAGTAQQTTAENLLIVKEYEARLRQAISLLSPQKRLIYQLSREQDLSHEEIASRLRLSKSTVNNQIVTAQRFIRDYLSNHLDMALVILFITSKK